MEVLGINVFRVTEKKNACVAVESIHGKDEQTITITKTPIGSLKTVRKNERIAEYPVKTVEDIKTMTYILEATETKVEFDLEGFKIADRIFGESGVVQA